MHAVLVEQLKSRRDELEAAVAAMGHADAPVELDQAAQGRLSRMDAIAQQEMARAGRAHLGVELERIDAALLRAAQGRYGLCCRCGQPIPVERLQADPSVPFCIDCLDEIACERREDARRFPER